MDEPAESPQVRRSLGLAIGVGVGVALAAVGIAYSIIAIPLYLLAQSEPDHGLDRPFIRHGLFQVAVPLGLLLGVAAGAVVGIWYARGGRLPTDRSPE